MGAAAEAAEEEEEVVVEDIVFINGVGEREGGEYFTTQSLTFSR